MATEKLSELVFIQSSLKVPKGQYNKFGNYYFRNCEDIMEAVKPLLKQVNCSLTVSDEVVQIANRVYVKSTAILETPTGKVYSNTAYAREPDMRKGMDEAQVTGATSSYARKYALNGLFCIDDNKDVDTTNMSTDSNQPAAQPAPQSTAQLQIPKVVFDEINNATSNQALGSIYYKYPMYQQVAQFTGALTARKDQLAKNGKS